MKIGGILMQNPVVSNEVVFRGTPNDVIWRSEVTVLAENAKIYSRKDCDIIFLRKGAFLGAFNDRDEYYLTNNQHQDFLDKLFHGKKHSDDCEIFYINRLAQLENKWGTQDRIDIYDPDYDMHTTVGAHGSYKFSIMNSMKLFSKVQGSAGSISQEMIKEFFHSELNVEIRNAIASVFHKNKYGLRDIATITMKEKEISEGMKEILIPVFSDYGVSLDKFYIARFMYDEDFLDQIRELKKEIVLNRMKFEAEKEERKESRKDLLLNTKAAVKLNKSNPVKPDSTPNVEKLAKEAIDTQTRRFCTKCGGHSPKSATKCEICGEAF